MGKWTIDGKLKKKGMNSEVINQKLSSYST